MSRTLSKGVGLLVAVVLLGVMWHLLQRYDLLTQARLSELIDTVRQWRDAPWMFAAVMAVYAGALLVMFPLSLLVVVTGKGPERTMYEDRISRMALQYVHIKTMWLEMVRASLARTAILSSYVRARSSAFSLTSACNACRV